MALLDPATPVVVGVGQVAEGLGPTVGRSPAALAGDAARAALTDALTDALAGAPGDPRRLSACIDVVACVRLFEDSELEHPSPLGRSTNLPRSVAARIGADPARAVLEIGGGQSPQHLVNEFAGEIAAGRVRAVLIAGAEALSTARHWAPRAAELGRPWDEDPPGTLEDRGPGLEDMTSPDKAAVGLVGAPAAYGLFEHARRARLGLDRDTYAVRMGELFAPFTRVAAANPYAAAPTVKDPDELVRVTERNRLVADPYPRFLVARDQVNQGAAVLLMARGAALDLGLDPRRLVYLHGHADVRERDLLDRADLSRSPASVRAVEVALDQAGITAADLAAIDLYSCFPIAVSNIADAFGWAADDPRGLTRTGGLPFFGGPGNDYALHGIAEIVAAVRARPGTFGLATANGGILSKYSVGVYSTTPTPWRPGRSAALQAEVDSWPAPRRASLDVAGPARIAAYTVVHPRGGSSYGVVVGETIPDGARFLARTADDPATWALLARPEPVGALVEAHPAGDHVVVSDAS